MSAPPIPMDVIDQARHSVPEDSRQCMEVLATLLNEPTDVFVERLAKTFRFPFVSGETLLSLSPDFEIMPFAEAATFCCLAVRSPEGSLWLVISNPLNRPLRMRLEERINIPFLWYLAHYTDIETCLAKHEKHLRALDTVLSNYEDHNIAEPSEQNLNLHTIGQDDSPTIRLINSTIYDALQTGVSDIHLEMLADGMVIKYRIDGVLSLVSTLPGVRLAEQAISRIKVLADLDISERRVPQDGRFKLIVQARSIDLRVSIMPTIHGEDAVLRILDRQASGLTGDEIRLDNLGFDTTTVKQLRHLSQAPYGMLLVTGPTGSGKTTTLYAAISEIHTGKEKIVTIEDPVEYQLPGVTQIPVNDKKGLTFARGLRSILRHDPDRIMVGEIRDSETAQIAIQSALTGHLVFTTVHANNVFDVIGRFSHMGVDLYGFLSALNGVMAQRLIRLNCPHCSLETDISANDLSADLHNALLNNETSLPQLKRGKGCPQCRGTGYKGRRPVAETLILNDELRELLLAHTGLRTLKETARAQGFQPLREAALSLVVAGLTTLEEVNRVTAIG